jgi:hypothetical protein
MGSATLRRLADVTGWRRRGLGLVPAAALLVLSIAGCNATRRELVVHFSDSSTEQEHVAVLSACAHVAPHVSPEPIRLGRPGGDRSTDVRFRIDNATDRDIARLETCLYGRPGVLGASDTTDDTG